MLRDVKQKSYLSLHEPVTIMPGKASIARINSSHERADEPYYLYVRLTSDRRIGTRAPTRTAHPYSASFEVARFTMYSEGITAISRW